MHGKLVVFGVGGNKNASQTVAQILIGGITGKEGVVRVECSLGACCSRNGVSSGQGGEGSGCTSLFLTGVDEKAKATTNKAGSRAGYVIARPLFHLFRSPGQHRIVRWKRMELYFRKSVAYCGKRNVIWDPRNS